MFKNIFKNKSVLSSVSGAGGRFFDWIVREAFTGAWQQNIEYSRETVLSYHAVFSCVSLISADISKLPIMLMARNSEVWKEISKKNSNYSVLRKPNDYQNTIQFIENWINSKLIRGNAYIYKEMDNKGNISGLHVLCPDLVLPLVSDNGSVFYQIGQDNLSGINQQGLIVPADRIIHDRFNCFFHPLVGLSPLYASGLAAYTGGKMLENNSRYFQNGARPSGLLTVPEAISKEDAEALGAQWQLTYGGENYGKIAVLGASVKYQPLSTTAVENQMVEQLKITSEMVCSTFHVPSYKVTGNAPAYNNVQALEQAYYSQCLQKLIEDLELLLEEGLGLTEEFKIELDLSNLLRMDSKTQVDVLVAGVKGGIDTPNEARICRNKEPLPGGDTIWMQQQNYPMEVLAERRTPPEDSSINAPDVTNETSEDNSSSSDNDEDDKITKELANGLIALGNQVKEMSFEL